MQTTTTTYSTQHLILTASHALRVSASEHGSVGGNTFRGYVDGARTVGPRPRRVPWQVSCCVARAAVTICLPWKRAPPQAVDHNASPALLCDGDVCSFAITVQSRDRTTFPSLLACRWQGRSSRSHSRSRSPDRRGAEDGKRCGRLCTPGSRSPATLQGPLRDVACPASPLLMVKPDIVL